MAVCFTDRVRVNPDVLFRLMGEEAVLVNLSTERYLGLDPVGTRMWTVLTTAASIQAAFEELREEYDVEPAQLRTDIEELIEQLVGQQLVETAPPAETRHPPP